MTEHTETAIKHTPLTLRQVIENLRRIEKNLGHDMPVHLLVMHGEDEEDEWYGNLVTHIETDAFHDDQGLVVSLMAWPGAFSTPIYHEPGEWRPPATDSSTREATR